MTEKTTQSRDISQLVSDLVATKLEELDNKSSRIQLRLKEPENFSGKPRESVERWLFQVEQYFIAAGEEDDAVKVAFAGALLRDTALAWWETIVRDNVRQGTPEASCTWAQFKQHLQLQFTPVNRVRVARDKLAQLQQRTSVNAYFSTFIQLTFEIPDMGDEEKMDKFFRGLKPELKKFLTIKGLPTDFMQLVKAAEEIDSQLFLGNSYRSNPTTWSKPNDGPRPMELGTVQPVRNNKGVQRLPRHQLQEYIKNGQCFKCGEKGHIARRCPNDKRQ